jgi:3-phosphoshikimate 1-carboxyvinyltransferase
MSAESVRHPDRLTVEPLRAPPRAAVRVPGSKSITNRALVLAALSAGKGSTCELRGALVSEDTEVMVNGLRALGFEVAADWPAETVHVAKNRDGVIPAAAADLFAANSGTTMRFLTAMLALGRGRYRLDGVPRMRERPVDDLLAALRQLGVRAVSERDNGCPPVVVESEGLAGGRTQIKGDISSQFLSGLLMAAPLASGEVIIDVDGPIVSWPYVALTVAMLRQWGFVVKTPSPRQFIIPGGQCSPLRSYLIEPDASAASYFWAAAAVTGGEVYVEGLNGHSQQGDVRFLDVLEEMGCTVVQGEFGSTVRGGPLRGVDVDMNDISDTVMTLGAVACFAEGPTTVRNVAHIRHKETDRLAALAAELRRVGAAVEEFADGLTITPRPLRGAEVETYNDHRMAMSLALVGLRVPGVVVKNPGCVAKTYPGFFTDLDKLR